MLKTSDWVGTGSSYSCRWDKEGQKNHLDVNDKISILQTRNRNDTEREYNKKLLERDLTWFGEHTIQCIDDVLGNCAPET